MRKNRWKNEIPESFLLDSGSKAKKSYTFFSSQVRSTYNVPGHVFSVWYIFSVSFHCYSHSVGKLFIWFYGLNPSSKGLNNLLEITQLLNGGSSIQAWKPSLIVSINRSINSPTSVNICLVFPLVTFDKFSWLCLKPGLLFWILPFLPCPPILSYCTILFHFAHQQTI